MSVCNGETDLSRTTILKATVLLLGFLSLGLSINSVRSDTLLESDDSFYQGAHFLRVYLEEGERYRVEIIAQISDPREMDKIEIINVVRGYTIRETFDVQDGENALEFDAPYEGYYDVYVYLNWFDSSRIFVYHISQSPLEFPIPVVGGIMLVVVIIIILGLTVRKKWAHTHAKTKAEDIHVHISIGS